MAKGRVNKGVASLEALQALQAEKKAKVVAKAKLRRDDKAGRKAAQDEIDALVSARNAMAAELVDTGKVTRTTLWAMGGNVAKDIPPIGVCALYR